MHVPNGVVNEELVTREAFAPLIEEYQCEPWQAYLMFDACVRRQDTSPKLAEAEGRLYKYLPLLRDLLSDSRLMQALVIGAEKAAHQAISDAFYAGWIEGFRISSGNREPEYECFACGSRSVGSAE